MTAAPVTGNTSTVATRPPTKILMESKISKTRTGTTPTGPGTDICNDRGSKMRKDYKYVFETEWVDYVKAHR